MSISGTMAAIALSLAIQSSTCQAVLRRSTISLLIV
jgi:hypothetical protein